MIYVSVSDRAMLEEVKKLISARSGDLTDVEQQTFSAFCRFLEDADRAREAKRLQSLESVRKYRSTPEGQEKNRLSARQGAAKRRAREKAKKEANKQ